MLDLIIHGIGPNLVLAEKAASRLDRVEKVQFQQVSHFLIIVQTSDREVCIILET